MAQENPHCSPPFWVRIIQMLAVLVCLSHGRLLIWQQEVSATAMSAIDYVLSGDEEWWQLNWQINHQTSLTDGQIAPMYQRFEEIDGYRTPAKAAMILSGLGFGEADHSKQVSMFSGGWRMRLNLARTLMHRADVLLLDEPTNHLDLDAIFGLKNGY